MKKEPTIKNVLAELEHLEVRSMNISNDLKGGYLRKEIKVKYRLDKDYINKNDVREISTALSLASKIIEEARNRLQLNVTSKMLKGD